jgi:hypothetical protein
MRYEKVKKLRGLYEAATPAPSSSNLTTEQPHIFIRSTLEPSIPLPSNYDNAPNRFTGVESEYHQAAIQGDQAPPNHQLVETYLNSHLSSDPAKRVEESFLPPHPVKKGNSKLPAESLPCNLYDTSTPNFGSHGETILAEKGLQDSAIIEQSRLQVSEENLEGLSRDPITPEPFIRGDLPGIAAILKTKRPGPSRENVASDRPLRKKQKLSVKTNTILRRSPRKVVGTSQTSADSGNQSDTF